MHIQRPDLNLALGIDIHMKIAIGQPPLNQLDTTNLDNPMTIAMFKTRSLSIQYDLTHFIFPTD
jgi:hypothetical protein